MRNIFDDFLNACVVSDDGKQRAGQITELLMICQDINELNILDHLEMQQILECLCNNWIYVVSDLEYGLRVRRVYCMFVFIMYLFLYSFVYVLT